MRLPVSLLLAVSLLLSCGRQHEQRLGPYSLTAEEILEDDCGLLTTPDALWDGTLESYGDVVRMEYGLLEMTLVGGYLAGVERFALDGSVANATTNVGSGEECLLDRVSVHLDATTVDENVFEGTIRVEYEARSPDTCVCKLSARYRAVHQ